MALIETQFTSLAPLGHRLGAPFRAIGRVLVKIAENNDRVRKVQALHSLSDAELARRGLKRDDIVRHVYGDYFYL